MSRAWGDLPARSEAARLPYPHRRALDVIVNHFGGRIVAVDGFVASLQGSALRDLVELGYLRKRFLGYEATLSGRRALTASSERTLNR